MHLLDLPTEVLSLIVSDTDRDTLLTLCLTEKHLLHEIARRSLRRNVAVVLDGCQMPKPNLLSLIRLVYQLSGPFHSPSMGISSWTLSYTLGFSRIWST